MTDTKQPVDISEFCCPFCGHAYSEAMLAIMDGTYGCDTGCDYYRIVIDCDTCGRVVYIKGDFGEAHSDPTWREDLEVGEIEVAIAERRRR